MLIIIENYMPFSLVVWVIQGIIAAVCILFLIICGILYIVAEINIYFNEKNYKINNDVEIF